MDEISFIGNHVGAAGVASLVTSASAYLANAETLKMKQREQQRRMLQEEEEERMREEEEDENAEEEEDLLYDTHHHYRCPHSSIPNFRETNVDSGDDVLLPPAPSESASPPSYSSQTLPSRSLHGP